MENCKLVKIKKNDKLGVIWCESSNWRNVKTLNTVILEDGSYMTLGDEEIEVLEDDRTN